MPRLLTAHNAVLAISAASAIAMLYVGAYQIRAVQHLSCPLFAHGCEDVADAPFARPWGVPDGFLAAGMYGLLMVLAFGHRRIAWVRYSVRVIALLAAAANVLGVLDMSRFGAYCFYCLLTTALAPVLVWMAFRTD